jgi:hypothetical protein
MRPLKAIRRFDVFAEYNRLERMEGGMPADEAKGHALWVAKVVAAKKFGKLPREPKPVSEWERRERALRKWHELNGVEQTEELFDKEIVERMGKDFYESVFSPAIQKARREAKEYRQIRDSIRKDWKP